MDPWLEQLITAARIARGAWAVLWLFIGGAFIVTGVALTIGLLIGKPGTGISGPIAIVLGIWVGGYVPVWRALKEQGPKP